MTYDKPVPHAPEWRVTFDARDRVAAVRHRCAPGGAESAAAYEPATHAYVCPCGAGLSPEIIDDMRPPAPPADRA